MPGHPTALRVVYRIVRSDPPGRRDFLAASGRDFADPHQSALARGISVFRTAAQARRQARRYDLGTHIAEVQVPLGCEIHRTLRTSGHHTVIGDHDALLAAVVAVMPVD